MNNIAEQRFGRLIAKTPTHRPGQKGIFWECTCDCGHVKIISGNSLRLNRTLSCGCLQKERARAHGLVNAPEARIIDLYKKGYTGKDIATDLGVGRGIVFRVLREKNVKMQSGGRRQNRNLRHDAFELLDEQSAYWIGFLMADGCIYRNDVILALSEVDERHLEKFRDFLRADTAIRRRKEKRSKRDAVSFQVASKHLVASLCRFGVTPRKTFTAKPPHSLADNHNFWRGMVDGDGSLTHRGKQGYLAAICLVGTRETCDGFLRFSKITCPSIRAQVQPCKSIFSISFAGKNARAIVRILYGDATVFLDRKKQKSTTSKWRG